jgi:hypothetical protein
MNTDEMEKEWNTKRFADRTAIAISKQNQQRKKRMREKLKREIAQEKSPKKKGELFQRLVASTEHPGAGTPHKNAVSKKETQMGRVIAAENSPAMRHLNLTFERDEAGKGDLKVANDTPRDVNFLMNVTLDEFNNPEKYALETQLLVKNMKHEAKKNHGNTLVYPKKKKSGGKRRKSRKKRKRKRKTKRKKGKGKGKKKSRKKRGGFPIKKVGQEWEIQENKLSNFGNNAFFKFIKIRSEAETLLGGPDKRWNVTPSAKRVYSEQKLPMDEGTINTCYELIDEEPPATDDDVWDDEVVEDLKGGRRKKKTRKKRHRRSRKRRR